MKKFIFTLLMSLLMLTTVSGAKLIDYGFNNTLSNTGTGTGLDLTSTTQNYVSDFPLYNISGNGSLYGYDVANTANNIPADSSTGGQLDVSQATISVWFKADVNSITTDNYMWRLYSSGSSFITIRREADDEDLYFMVRDDNVYYANDKILEYDNDQTWHHAAMVFDATSCEVFIDAELVLNDTTCRNPSDVVLGNIAMGAYSGTSLFWEGLFDEFRFYDEALTPENVSNLYNYGEPEGFEAPPTPTPAIAYNITNGSTTSINPPILLTTTSNVNMSVSLNGAAQSSICTDCNSTVYTPSLVLGQNNITFVSTDANGQENSSLTLILDTSLPYIMNNIPTEINSYFFNLSQYLTCTDDALVYCNATFLPDNIVHQYNDTSLINFTYSGNKSYTIYAKDNVGNTNTTSGTLLVNPYATFQFTYSNGTPISNYTLAGQSFNDVAQFNFYNDILTINQNNTLLWEKAGFSSQNITVFLDNTSRINNTYNASNAVITFEIRDQETFQLVSGPEFTLTLLAIVGAQTTTTNGTATLSNLFFEEERYEVIASATGYEAENAYFDFTNKEAITVPIYVVNSSNVNLGYVTIDVTGKNSEPLGGVVVRAKQWDANSSTYITVSQGQTSGDGSATVNVILNSEAYIFEAERDGDIVQSPSETITSDENGKTIPLSFQDEILPFEWDLNDYNGLATESFNNVTNISTITFTFSHDDNIEVTGCINLYKVLDNVERLILSNCTSSTSATKVVNFLINSSQFTVLKAEFLIEGDYVTVKPFKYEPTNSIQNLLLITGLYVFVLLLCWGLAIWFGFEVFDNIYIMLILIIVSSFTVSKLVPTIIPNLIATVIGVMASITLWGIYKRK